MVADQRHLHVLGNGHRTEGGCDLKRAADAEAPDVARLPAGDAATGKLDVAGVRRELPVDHVEAGRFTRPIRADERQEFAFTDLEADVFDGVHTAEGLR